MNNLPKSCLITGASGEIGMALASEFYDAGYNVIATDLFEKEPQNIKCHNFFSMDLEKFVKDENFSKSMIDKIMENYLPNGLDVLINNAAIQMIKSSKMICRDDFRKSFEINLFAPFFLTQALIDCLKKKKGCVINISSIHSSLTKKNFLLYATTKAALSSMTRSMALDFGDEIRVNAIEPAAIDSKMLRDGFMLDSQALNRLNEYHPSKSIGNPYEVAILAHAIADERMKFLHGACITLDGAISSRLYDPS